MLSGDVAMQEYDDLLHEFMCACKQAYGEKVLVQVRAHLSKAHRL